MASSTALQMGPQDGVCAATDSPLQRHVHRVLAGEAVANLHFQPIVDLARGVMTGFEVLARFPGKECYPPDHVFGAAGQMGLSVPLEALVVTQALEARSQLPQNCFLSINMSGAFILSQEWQRIAAGCHSLTGIVIELTEQEAIADYDRIRQELDRVQRAGALVAVDDAGAGYASLKHVLEIKPNFIKLDRIFVQDCHRDPAKAALIEMIGLAGSRMDSWIIAEGIEVAGELAELCRLGIPLGQGYLLGRPAPEMPSSTLVELPAQLAPSNISPETSLAPHMMSCPTFDRSDEAGHSLYNTEAHDIAAVVDEFGRPITLLERHPHLGVRILPTLMMCQALTDPAEVLSRALTRSAATRFDAFAVINERGALQGVVRIDRLMRGLLQVTRERV